MSNKPTNKPKNSAACPKCGVVGKLTPAERPGRVQLLCNCNPNGPVLEMDAEPEPTNEPETEVQL